MQINLVTNGEFVGALTEGTKEGQSRTNLLRAGVTFCRAGRGRRRWHPMQARPARTAMQLRPLTTRRGTCEEDNTLTMHLGICNGKGIFCHGRLSYEGCGLTTAGRGPLHCAGRGHVHSAGNRASPCSLPRPGRDPSHRTADCMFREAT